MKTLELINFIDAVLKPKLFKDYCPNGLQIQGKNQIHKIITGVTASNDLIDCAIEEKADAILVHHGYFWKGENQEITGIKHNRIKKLLAHDINLIAYHLPLDAHIKLGNNAQLAQVLELINPRPISERPSEIIWRAELATAISATDFAKQLQQKLAFSPTVIEADKIIQSIAFCTGGAQSFIEQAAMLGVDAYLSGEISEPTAHAAKELDIHYFAAGHHATERYGVKALGEYIAEHQNIDVKFIDLPIPV